MKRVAGLAGVVVLLIDSNVWGLPTGRDIYFGSHYRGTERTLYRDGVTVVHGINRLQPVLTVDGVNDGVWTNEARDYLGGNDVTYTGNLAATTVGDDPLLGEYTEGSGEWNTRIEGGDTERGGNVYYVRVFSASTITGAAYYADTVNIHGTFPTTAYEDFTDIVVNVVNPAYVIPGFRVTFPTNEHVEVGAMIMARGEVGTTRVGGNNQLADDMVSVRWENVTLGTSGYVAVNDGGWVASEIPLLVGERDEASNELRFVAVGISPKPGLPVSEEVGIIRVLAVPEVSVTVGAFVGLVAIVMRRKDGVW